MDSVERERSDVGVLQIPNWSRCAEALRDLRKSREHRNSRRADISAHQHAATFDDQEWPITEFHGTAISMEVAGYGLKGIESTTPGKDSLAGIQNSFGN